jgi:WD40 repeat protein
MDFTVRLWDAQTGEEIYMIGQHGDPHTQVNHIAWSPDGTKLAVTTADFGIKILDASDGHLISQVANSNYGACCSINVVWSSDGKQIASRDLVSLSDYSPIEIDVWHVESVEKIRTIEEFDEFSWFDMFLWSVGGRYFIIPNGNVQFVDSLTGELFHMLGEPLSGFTELSQSQGGRVLASLNDWSISVWVLPQ